MLLANLGAALAYLPWVSGAIADFNSPTTDVLSRLQPFDWGFIRNSLEHWLFAHPYGLVALDDIPGYPAFFLLGLGVLLGLGAALVSGLRQRKGMGISVGVGLVIVLALATPVGEALAGVVSTNLLGTRNLAASWTGFALLVAAIVSCAANRPARLLASTAVVAAFAIAAVKMLQSDHRRPDTRQAAALIAAQPPRSTLVVDAAVISPGPYSSLDADLADPRYRVIRSGAPRQRSHPFRVTDDSLTPQQATAQVSRLSRPGTRVFAVVLPPRLGSISAGTAREFESLLPSRFHLETRTVSPGMVPITTLVFRDRGRPRG